MRTSAKWVKSFITLFILILFLSGAFMVIVDPCFHYHAPLPYFSYTLDNARYQNDGIVKHFDYDALITGSSMTECFKTSDLDALFQVNSIKVPYSGGSFKEVNDNLMTACKSQPKLKLVIRGLDCNRFFNDKDDMDYSEYPTYLYDNFIFNDVNYIYNKNLMLTALQNVIGRNSSGKIQMSFDEYCNWTNYYAFGKDVVDDYYKRDTVVPAETQKPITQEDYAKIDANIEQNVTRVADLYPDIDFYIYITPYSIYYMDYWKLLGDLERQLLAERHIIELLLEHDNIHVFSFYTQHDVVNNLDNYRDVAHHKGEVNTQILNWMKEGTGLLTKENYTEYCDYVWDYYTNFDYDALFAK